MQIVRLYEQKRFQGRLLRFPAELRHAYVKGPDSALCGVDRMKIRLGYVLPAMLLLAGCATTNNSGYVASNAATPTVAPPQRVDAVSDAVGAKVDAMITSRPAPSDNVTR